MIKLNLKLKQSSAYRKGYKKGYNNPGQFDQTKLLRFDNDLANGIVAGICERAKDNANNTVVFK